MRWNDCSLGGDINVLFEFLTDLIYNTLQEHQMTLTFAIFQKFLITMVVYENFFFPWKLLKAFLLIQQIRNFFPFDTAL